MNVKTFIKRCLLFIGIFLVLIALGTLATEVTSCAHNNKKYCATISNKDLKECHENKKRKNTPYCKKVQLTCRASYCIITPRNEIQHCKAFQVHNLFKCTKRPQFHTKVCKKYRACAIKAYCHDQIYGLGGTHAQSSAEKYQACRNEMREKLGTKKKLSPKCTYLLTYIKP